ncbi:MAG: M48 family metalloprotease [Solirubrobacterales bacterium]|nr:M48 family metalloprotease [Solirubrobacterales bacterium]
MNPGSPAAGRLKLSGLFLAAAGALLVAWVLALLFAAPLRTGPVDLERAGAVIESKLGSGEIERAEEYRSGQRRIAAASITLDLVLLGLLAFWRPAPFRRLLARLDRRPILGAGLVGAGLAALVAVAGIPLGLLALERGRDYGLISQGIGGWVGDLVVSTGITMLLAAVGAAVAMVLWRRLEGRFWLAASVLAIGYAVISVWLWPVLVSPLFNRFEPLPDGPVRREVFSLADRAGVDLGQVLEVDASRRSTGLNAYVDGIGSTRRMVIYDNALRDLNPEELRSLFAHELTHADSNDLRRGLAYAILIIPLGALSLQFATRLLVRRSGDDPGGPGVIPALAFGLTVATLVLSVPGNWLSRRVEANADAGAIALTGSHGLVELQLRLARENLADPDPPGAWQFLFGTHPTTLERIGMAEAIGAGPVGKGGE